MDTMELQAKVRNGDSDAFRLLYRQYVNGVYQSAQAAQLSDEVSRTIVKEVFVQVYREITACAEPLDLDQRVNSLTAQAIADRFISIGTSRPRHVARHAHPQETEPARSAEDDLPDSPAEDPALPPKVTFWSVLSILLSCLFLLFAIWVLLGVLMSLKVIPTLDLGYRAFDRVLFPLFYLE